MFLKHYTKLSDEKLLERFNTDWAIQMFCGALLSDNEMIRDNSFVSSVRVYSCESEPPILAKLNHCG
jgi:transposase, IS5 family